MFRCYIGIGSNLEHPVQQVTQALEELQNIPDTQVISASRLYRSDPVGPVDQPVYINAVAAIDTLLEPEYLLDQLQAIEAIHDRKRAVRWGPRTLDLDLLLFADHLIKTDRLTVPHIEMGNRAFVLYPLAEIAPNLKFPDGRLISDFTKQCTLGTVEPIEI